MSSAKPVLDPAFQGVGQKPYPSLNAFMVCFSCLLLEIYVQEFLSFYAVSPLIKI